MKIIGWVLLILAGLVFVSRHTEGKRAVGADAHGGGSDGTVPSAEENVLPGGKVPEAWQAHIIPGILALVGLALVSPAVLLLTGTFTVCAAAVSIVWPLRFLSIPSREKALELLAIGLVVTIFAAVLVDVSDPEPAPAADNSTAPDEVQQGNGDYPPSPAAPPESKSIQPAPPKASASPPSRADTSGAGSAPAPRSVTLSLLGGCKIKR